MDLDVQENESVIDKLNREFLLSWEWCTGPFAGSRKVDEGALAIRWADIGFRFYNALCFTEAFHDAGSITTAMEKAIGWMRNETAPGWLVVTEDNLTGEAPEAFARFVEQQALVTMNCTGMGGELLPLDSPTLPELRFERIWDDATVTDFITLNCLAYGIPLEEGLTVVGDTSFWRTHAYGYVAYDGDTPVSTATGIVAGDCIFLFLVATRPETQRRGYGDAVVRYALNAAHAATGIRRTSLQASDAGRPVYARLGYREVCRYTLVWPA